MKLYERNESTRARTSRAYVSALKCTLHAQKSHSASSLVVVGRECPVKARNCFERRVKNKFSGRVHAVKIRKTTISGKQENLLKSYLYIFVLFHVYETSAGSLNKTLEEETTGIP